MLVSDGARNDRSDEAGQLQVFTKAKLVGSVEIGAFGDNCLPSGKLHAVERVCVMMKPR